MKSTMKAIEKKAAKLKFKPCNTITCIHNIDNKCMLNKCEVYERSLKQEY
jgi:hypothetical protein